VTLPLEHVRQARTRDLVRLRAYVVARDPEGEALTPPRDRADVVIDLVMLGVASEEGERW
jgi:hypothetical protein